jgi:hypothetical protein
VKNEQYDWTGEEGGTAPRKQHSGMGSWNWISGLSSPTSTRCECGADIRLVTNGMGVLVPINVKTRHQHRCDFTHDPFTRHVAKNEY